MTTSAACFGTLQVKSWTEVRFDRLLFLLLLGAVFVGSWEESEPGRETASGSAEDQPLLQHSFASVLPMPLQSPRDTNMTENAVRRRRSSDDSVLPPKFLTAAHLSSLRELVSDKKITVRLGFRVSLSGPSELLDPQLLLSMYKEPGIYNIGDNAGVFTMRVVGVKRVTNTP